MASLAEEERPSGPGESRQLAKQAAASIAARDPVTNVVKIASLKQFSCIAAIGCAKSGFPTFNRHLYKDELLGLGWRDLEMLTANLAKGNDARDESRIRGPSPAW